MDASVRFRGFCVQESGDSSELDLECSLPGNH